MISQILTTLVFNSTALSMYEGDNGWVNLMNDEAPAENVYLVDPIKFGITNLTFLTEAYPVVMLFIGKTELDQTPSEVNAVVEAQRLNVRKFLAEARDSSAVASITNIDAIQMTHFSDADYSGWMLYCTITPANTEPVCF